jgi:hypothetical protein
MVNLYPEPFSLSKIIGAKLKSVVLEQVNTAAHAHCAQCSVRFHKLGDPNRGVRGLCVGPQRPSVGTGGTI